MEPNNQIRRIFDLLQHYEEGIFKDRKEVFVYKREGKWIHLSSLDYVQSVNLLCNGLYSLGIRKGDKVASILRNGPEWNILDMALLSLGAVQVPIYPTISSRNFSFIFQDSQVKIAFVSDDALREQISEACKECGGLQNIFVCNDDSSHSWSSLFLADAALTQMIKTAKQEINEADLATIIYTSGTTGIPKGVMLTHKNVVSNFIAVSSILENAPSDIRKLSTALSFLPLCHVYERIINYMYQKVGITVYYESSLEFLRESFTEVRPDILSAVPRVLEKAYDRFLMRGRYLKGYERMLFVAALRIAQRYELNGANGRWYSFRLFLARILILRKWKEAFGGRLKVIVSGGATLNERLTRTYWAAGIRVMDGYGLTETSPVVSVGNFQKEGVRFGTVGPILPGLDVRIAEDGEVLVKGPNVMAGYLNRPERTFEVLDAEGWFHTGDIGMMVESKYLKITDRKKEIFKTSGGKYIAPQVIENKFRESDFIEQVMVVGERRNYTAALILPNFIHLQGWCGSKGIPWKGNEAMISEKRVIERFQREIGGINKSLDHIEKIKRFILLVDEWSVESAELSPTLKLRRKAILGRYEELIDAMYRETEGFNA